MWNGKGGGKMGSPYGMKGGCYGSMKGDPWGGSYGPMKGDPWGAWSKGGYYGPMYPPYGGMGGGWGDSYGGDPEKDALVSRVKAIQRSGDEDKQKWWNFCDRQNTGTRDPSRHNVDFLRRFLDAYDSGDVPEVSAASPGQELGGQGGNILRLRGLPFSCKAAEVAEFLADFAIEESQVLFTMSPEGRPSGEAYVTFHSNEDAERALSEKQRQHMGSRYVELFKASKDEWVQAKGVGAKPKPAAARGSGGCYGAVPSSYATLRLRGLPFSAGPSDVVKFLSEYNVDAWSVVFGIGNDGRPSGEAFVAFPDEASATRALEEKQNEKVGNRYIELFKSSYEEWMAASAAQYGYGWGMPMCWPPYGPCGFGGPWGGKGGGGSSQSASYQGSSDPEKGRLVERIKTIQRTSDELKEYWWNYADTEGGGIRDPNRHKASFLESFLEVFDSVHGGRS